jgi:ABC-2 type transport system ATP-binding protein
MMSLTSRGWPLSEARPQARKTLERLGLASYSKIPSDDLSGGLRQRTLVAMALATEAELIFLDEPTIGLDPQTRSLVWDDVDTLRREEGVTIFLTTHYMEEAEIADRIAIIDHGLIVALDTPERLKASVGADTVDLQTNDNPAALSAIRAAGFHAEQGADKLTVFTENGESQVAHLVEIVGGGVTSVHVHRPNLDDVFLHFTGREIREQAGEAHSGMVRAWGHRR